MLCIRASQETCIVFLCTTSAASRGVVQQTELTIVTDDLYHVTQAGI